MPSKKQSKKRGGKALTGKRVPPPQSKPGQEVPSKFSYPPMGKKLEDFRSPAAAPTQYNEGFKSFRIVAEEMFSKSSLRQAPTISGGPTIFPLVPDISYGMERVTNVNSPSRFLPSPKKVDFTGTEISMGYNHRIYGDSFSKTTERDSHRPRQKKTLPDTLTDPVQKEVPVNQDSLQGELPVIPRKRRQHVIKSSYHIDLPKQDIVDTGNKSEVSVPPRSSSSRSLNLGGAGVSQGGAKKTLKRKSPCSSVTFEKMTVTSASAKSSNILAEPKVQEYKKAAVSSGAAKFGESIGKNTTAEKETLVGLDSPITDNLPKNVETKAPTRPVIVTTTKYPEYVVEEFAREGDFDYDKSFDSDVTESCSDVSEDDIKVEIKELEDIAGVSPALDGNVLGQESFDDSDDGLSEEIESNHRGGDGEHKLEIVELEDPFSVNSFEYEYGDNVFGQQTGDRTVMSEEGCGIIEGIDEKGNQFMKMSDGLLKFVTKFMSMQFSEEAKKNIMNCFEFGTPPESRLFGATGGENEDFNIKRWYNAPAAAGGSGLVELEEEYDDDTDDDLQVLFEDGKDASGDASKASESKGKKTAMKKAPNTKRPRSAPTKKPGTPAEGGNKRKGSKGTTPSVESGKGKQPPLKRQRRSK